MATFETQIEAITSIDITSSSTPTQDELTQFLLDGIKEMVDRAIKHDPSQARLFTTTVAVDNNWESLTTNWENSEDWTNSATNGTAINNGILISVTRENGTEGSHEPATPIPPNHRTRATDQDSLFYRSAYNPGWYILDGRVYIVPAPSGTASQAHITYVTYGEAITYSSSNLASIPDQYEYLVVLHASIKALKAAAADQTIQEDTELTNSYLTLANSLTQEYDKRLPPFVPKREAQTPQSQR